MSEARGCTGSRASTVRSSSSVRRPMAIGSVRTSSRTATAIQSTPVTGVRRVAAGPNAGGAAST